jgi:hypothetical protein
MSVIRSAIARTKRIPAPALFWATAAVVLGIACFWQARTIENQRAAVMEADQAVENARALLDGVCTLKSVECVFEDREERAPGNLKGRI